MNIIFKMLDNIVFNLIFINIVVAANTNISEIDPRLSSVYDAMKYNNFEIAVQANNETTDEARNKRNAMDRSDTVHSGHHGYRTVEE